MAGEKAAAIVTIRNADKMTKKGRKAVAAWLHKQADYLDVLGTEYAGTFRARYLYK